MSQPILVTGATGTVGEHVIHLLLSAGHSVRAAARDVHSMPVEPNLVAVPFDFTDPTTWQSAFDGISVMFLVRPPALSRVKRDLLPALSAAQEAGMRHVVFLSLQGADRNPVVPHAAIERWLRRSAMTWTFVRPSFFMQNLSTTHRRDIRDHHEIVVPAGGGRTAFVDAHDVAAVAAAALLEPSGHTGRSWTPTGPAALSYAEAAADLSQILGRQIRYTRPGLISYARHARRVLGMPTGMVLVTAAIYTSARLGLAAGLTRDVMAVTGREPLSFDVFARRERAAWITDLDQRPRGTGPRV